MGWTLGLSGWYSRWDRTALYTDLEILTWDTFIVGSKNTISALNR